MQLNNEVNKRTVQKSEFGKVGFSDMASRDDYQNKFYNNYKKIYPESSYKFIGYDTEMYGFEYEKNDSQSINHYKEKYFGSNGIGEFYKDEIVCFVKELLCMDSKHIALWSHNPHGTHYYEPEHGPFFYIDIKWHYGDNNFSELRERLQFVKEQFEQYGLWNGFIININNNGEWEIEVRTGLHESMWEYSRVAYYEDPSNLPTKLLLLL